MGGRGRRISEFKASVVCRVSSRTARDTQRNLVWKNKTKKPKTNKQKMVHVCNQEVEAVGAVFKASLNYIAKSVASLAYMRHLCVSCGGSMGSVGKNHQA